jgi:hypothetical protein
MADKVARTHHYHAQASILHGELERPLTQAIKPQASVTIPESGGYLSERAPNFRVEGVLSFASGYTHVAGHRSQKPGHGWVTLATSVVEGLNVMEVLTADRVVAQISTEHPLEGYVPTVTFLGSRFENLKIAGELIEPLMNPDICDQKPSKQERFLVEDKDFLSRVAEQRGNITKAKGVPQWAAERYHWKPESVKSRAHVECSIVTGLKKPYPGSFGHVIDVPHFGRIFLGGLRVDHLSFHLTMIRIEMGCIGHGTSVMASAYSNGRTAP